MFLDDHVGHYDGIGSSTHIFFLRCVLSFFPPKPAWHVFRRQTQVCNQYGRVRICCIEFVFGHYKFVLVLVTNRRWWQQTLNNKRLKQAQTTIKQRENWERYSKRRLPFKNYNIIKKTGQCSGVWCVNTG